MKVNHRMMKKNRNKNQIRQLYIQSYFNSLKGKLYIGNLYSKIIKSLLQKIAIQIMGKKQNEDKPAPPKRALSAFFLFREEVYNKVKSEHPDAKITELTKIISEMWRNIDQATKDRLEAKYQENKTKVAQQKAAYVDKYGKIEKKKKKKHAKKE